MRVSFWALFIGKSKNGIRPFHNAQIVRRISFRILGFEKACRRSGTQRQIPLAEHRRPTDESENAARVEALSLTRGKVMKKQNRPPSECDPAENPVS